MGQDCKYCGAYIAGDADRCPACGKRVKGAGASASATAASYEPEYTQRGEEKSNGAYTYKQEYERRYGSDSKEGESSTRQTSDGQTADRKYDGGASSRPATATEKGEKAGDPDDVRENRSICFLCYLGIFFLIPYFLKRDSEFVKFHSNQGLLLLLAEIIVSVCSDLFVVGWLIGAVGGIFILISFIKGMTNVGKGVMAPLPVIGDIRILK